MNHTVYYLTRISRPVISFIIILAFVNSLVGCKFLCKTFCYQDETPKKPWYSSANLILSNPVTDQTIKDALKDAAQKAGGFLTDNDIKIRRCPCDSLINLELPPGWIIEGHDEKMAVRTPGGGQSGGVDLPGNASLAVGLNFQINTFDPSQQRQERPESAGRENFYKAIALVNPASTKRVKIAIFDSGLYTDGSNGAFNSYLPASYLLPTSLCVNTTNTGQVLDPASTSLKGWNFTNEGGFTDTNDKTEVHHGSRVANLIARQFNSSDILPQIVPMKVLNGNNQGDLYGLMCAMKTAQKNGVTIFNMSLGYYGEEDTLLRKYVKEAQQAGIWMVVAAGNHLVDTAGMNRDLTSLKPKFYPATFAADYKRIVPVTTVSKAAGTGQVTACARQNYTNQYVIGAMDNSVNCRFRMGDGPNSTPVDVFGTSYASPVVAGWLGVQLIKSQGTLTKRDDIPGRIPAADQGTGNQVLANKYVRSLP
ncbi:S8 family serine peptidase [Spirosoma linguale]|uniref:Peptidase S8/S53 domain-containing protein n=1 Tax=Spirosoma linguale (strain ATCC 33905 / DSM 74 / LMG 10896 / Claus 1) TaxID=504472 RepID=D2QID9_SPILD|nr:hypothetical protein Slin_2707 [Spirosoma linguale DSM 74]